MDALPLGLRERKKLQTRKDLARAAVGLFAEQGYAATTVDDIAAAANVSRRTFFRYFKSKDEVLIVDPEGKLALLQGAFAAGPQGEPVLDALRRGMLALTEAYWDAELSRAIIDIMFREPEAAMAAVAYQARFVEVMVRELATALDVDIWVDPRPQILSYTAIALVRSAVATWLQDDELTPLERAGEAFDVSRPTLEAILAMPTAERSRTD